MRFIELRSNEITENLGTRTRVGVTALHASVVDWRVIRGENKLQRAQLAWQFGSAM